MLLKVSRCGVALGLIALGVSGVVSAATMPSTGLGETWPNTTDVSMSLRYHVYVFERDGVRFIQVNQPNGSVDAAVAVANGTVLPLPIGRHAAYIRVRPARSNGAAPMAPAVSTAETVYQDEKTTIMMAPLSNGATQMVVQTACDDPARCSG